MAQDVNGQWPVTLADKNGNLIDSTHPLFLQMTAGSAVIGVLGAGEAHIGAVGGHTFRSHGTFTRPNDTNSYAANDLVSNSTSATTAIDLPNCARVAGGGVTIMTARMCVSVTAQTQTFRLWLYRDTPGSPPVDNAAFSQTAANKDLRHGYIDFNTPVSGSDVTDYYGTLVFGGPSPVVPVGTSLKGLLQVTSAWTTPTAQAVIDIYINGYQD